MADPFEQFVIELVDGCKEIGKTKREEGKKSERSVKHKHIEGKSESICQKGYRENVILKMAAIVGEQ